MPFKEKKYNQIGRHARDERYMDAGDVVKKLKHYGTHISKQTLYNYENGQSDMPATVMFNLCKIYKCSVYDLLNPISKIEAEFKEPKYTHEVYQYLENNSLYPLDSIKFAYDYSTNTFIEDHDIAHAIFDFDDINTGLLRGTRVVYKKRGDFKIRITPSYNYYYLEQEVQVGNKRYRLKFFTKAMLVENSVTPRIVQYFYKGQIKHISEKAFKAMVEGIVVKIIYDRSIEKHTETFFY